MKMYNMRIIDLSSTITPNSRGNPWISEDGDCLSRSCRRRGAGGRAFAASGNTPLNIQAQKAIEKQEEGIF